MKLYELTGRTGFCLAPSIARDLGFGDRFTLSELEVLASVESMTDDCARDQIGSIETVPAQDRLYGDHGTVAMANFAYWDIERGLRADGMGAAFSFALDSSAAIAASMRKIGNFLTTTAQRKMHGAIPMSIYAMTLTKRVLDCRGKTLEEALVLAADERLHQVNVDGLIVQDSRCFESEFVVAFSAGLISGCAKIASVEFKWNGTTVEPSRIL